MKGVYQKYPAAFVMDDGLGLRVVIGGVTPTGLVNFKFLVEIELDFAVRIREVFENDFAKKYVFFVVDSVGQIQLDLEMGIDGKEVAGHGGFDIVLGNFPGAVVDPAEAVVYPDADSVNIMAVHGVFQAYVGEVEVADLTIRIQAD